MSCPACPASDVRPAPRFCPRCGRLIPGRGDPQGEPKADAPAPEAPPPRGGRSWARPLSGLLIVGSVAAVAAVTFAVIGASDGDADGTGTEAERSAAVEAANRRQFVGPAPAAGEVAWRVDLEPPEQPLDDRIAPDVVVTGGVTIIRDAPRGHLVGIDSASGATLWTRAERSQRVAAVADLAVVLSSGGIQAVDPLTGRLLWTHDDPEVSAIRAVSADVMIAGGDEMAVGIETATGETLWRAPITPRIGPVTFGSGTVVYWDPVTQTLTARDATTGEQLWTWSSATADQTFVFNLWEEQGTVLAYVYEEGEDVTIVRAFEARTGAVLWEDRPGHYPSAVAAGHLVTRHDGRRGGLTARRVEDGTTVWELATPEAVSVYTDSAAGEVLYLVTAGATDVTALDVATGRNLWTASDIPTAHGEFLTIAGDYFFAWQPGTLTAISLPDAVASWSYDLRPWQSCDPLVAAGLVYAPAGRGLLAVDATTGTPRWTYGPFDGDDIEVGDIATDGDLLALFATSRGAPPRPTLHVADTADGIMISTRELRGRPADPPLVVAGEVVIAGNFVDFHLARIHAPSGRPWWSRRVDGRMLGRPALVGDTLVVATSVGLFGVDLATGEDLWHARRKLADGPPVVVGRTAVVVSDNRMTVAAFEVGDGELRWEHELDARTTQRPAADDDAIYLTTRTALVALDAQSGRASWAQPLDSTPAGPPAAVDDAVIVVTTDRRILTFDRRAGEPIPEFDAGELVHGAFTVDEGQIYACTPDGHLVTLR